MNPSSSTRVVLFQIRKSFEKLKSLINTAELHFNQKESFIIFAEDKKAAEYVDELLWKSPQTSFLPHILSDIETNEYIVINHSKNNVNKARFAFNLSPTPLLVQGPFKIIYDFEDLTSPSKKQFSEIRFDSYKKSGYLIESRAV
jgi:DNA polymerase III subunit chi